MSKHKQKTKESMWIITVQKEVRMKVVFDRELTKDEAIKAFDHGEYADVIDEYVIIEEAVEIA